MILLWFFFQLLVQTNYQVGSTMLTSRLPSRLQSKIGSEGTLGGHGMWNSFADIDSVVHSLQNQLEQGGKQLSLAFGYH